MIYKNKIDSALQITKPSKKHNGKVITEVISISVIIFLFTLAPLALPLPIIDRAFTFPVLIGIPIKEQIKRVIKEPMSEKKARGVSKLSTDFDRVLIIFLPPNMVERHITRETMRINVSGTFEDSSLLIPSKNIIIAMNFCPS